jgi:hypothetical protein
VTAATVAELTRPEHIVLWGLRRWLHHQHLLERLEYNGPTCRERLEPELVRTCGETGGALAAAALDDLLSELTFRGRRPRRFFHLNNPDVSIDEGMVLSIIAAFQGGADDLAGARLEWLLAAPSREVATGAARSLADVLDGAGHRLPLRTGELGNGWLADGWLAMPLQATQRSLP